MQSRVQQLLESNQMYQKELNTSRECKVCYFDAIFV